MKLNPQNKALLALFASAMLFGSTFLVVKNLLDDLSPMFVVFCRFLIASIFFLIIGGIPNKNSIKPGLVMGFFLWLGYYTQTEGLVTSSTINSGVVTGFYVVLTPLLSKLINRTDLQTKNYVFSYLGFTGILLISSTSIDQMFGNLFTFVCAMSYAIHIVLVEKEVNNFNISNLMFVQSLFGASLCMPYISIIESTPIVHNIVPIVFLGLVVNVGAFYLQLFGQKFVKASTSSLILSLEAIFAILIGISLASEVLNLINWIGVAIVLLSIFGAVRE